MEPRVDETILNQSITFIRLLNGERPDFVAQDAEDFCFAYVFNYMTAEEGAESFPSLRHHESDRTKVPIKALEELKRTGRIISDDHRVVQALVEFWCRRH